LALFDVTAIGLNPRTGRVVAGPRVERIDTDSNALFTSCSGEWDVEDAYEAFWNRLNDSWEMAFPGGKEKVKVLTVARIKNPSREWGIVAMR